MDPYSGFVKRIAFRRVRQLASFILLVLPCVFRSPFTSCVVEAESPPQSSSVAAEEASGPPVDQAEGQELAAFHFDSLREVFKASQGRRHNADTVKRTLFLGRRTLDTVVRQASRHQARQDTEVTQNETPRSLSSLPSFSITSISTLTLGGIEHLHFFCSLERVEASDDSAIQCSPPPQAFPGSLKVGFIFQLVSNAANGSASQTPADQAGPPLCRIVHDSMREEYPSYLESAIGICIAFGFDTQLLVHEGNPVLDLLPNLYPEGLLSLGFESVPARYVKPYRSLSFVGIKPVQPTPKVRRTDRGEADFLPNEKLDLLSWRGVAVSPKMYRKALARVTAAIENALISDGATKIQDCTIHVGSPDSYAAFLERVDGEACNPGKPLLGCLSAIRAATYTQESEDALRSMAKQVAQLTPGVSLGSLNMLSFLTEPKTWRTLHSLIGPPAARLFETPSQTAWYEEGMLAVKQHTAEKDVSLAPSSETLLSEALRFPLWFLDLFPSTQYWQSLKLGCVAEDLAYLREMGRVFIRQSPRHLEYAGVPDSKQQAREPPALLEEAVVNFEGQEGLREEAETFGDNDEATESILASAQFVLPNGKAVRPLQRVYAFEDLKAISIANPAEAATDDSIRKQWLASPLFDEQGDIQVTGVPARDGGTFDLRLLCTKHGRFRVSTGLVGWFSKYICEPAYVPKPNSEVTGQLREGDMPVNRLIGIEFEDRAPWRCGVSFLGTEQHMRETAVHGQDLLKIMTGLCSLFGFKTGWILDSVTDLSTKEKMKITMVLEKRISFYENQGFLLSINTFKSREHADTCIGSGVADPNAILSGICRQPQDILINPGFEANTFYTLVERTYDTLYNLTFDCTSPSWQNCGEAFPLSVMDPRGEGCAFERHPLFHELKFMNPEKCDVGRRIGGCHEFVRKHLKCNRKEKKGCKYLMFLHTQFLYPGGDVSKKLPDVIQAHYEVVGRDIHKEAGPLLFDAIRKSADNALSKIRPEEREGAPEVGEEDATQASNGEDEAADIESVRDMLLESLIFVDWTATPQFWIRALYEYDKKTGARVDTEEKKLFCPVAYAWAYITRLHGQLYRHASDYFHDNTQASPNARGDQTANGQNDMPSPYSTGEAGEPEESRGLEATVTGVAEGLRPIEQHQF
ncbi:hypothetical protein BESB_079940 [Besnoitia besnoiti]|uniref:Uncharacterized protein n=1 Tax=Besnoitia besnoiti TaxID=94643 RepID=A0A2A9M5M4_BESBE|nr:hypothetical protein BESB_079940 [Besnoitia besnoiti]PFH33778.1 hypothetical protein BESB_079940 [Besnoitia besnoiti]